MEYLSPKTLRQYCLPRGWRKKPAPTFHKVLPQPPGGASRPCSWRPVGAPVWDRAGEGLRLRSRPQAAPLNRPFADSPPPPAAGGQVQGGGSAPTSPPSRASGATLGRLAPELGEPSGCAARRWGLSISRIDKLPLEEGRAVSPRRRVTQGNLSRKNPLPAESRAGAGRAAAPARSRAPAPRRSPALPPPARPAVPPGPARLSGPIAGARHPAPRVRGARARGGG